jgi:FkbM family methyltransferase
VIRRFGIKNVQAYWGWYYPGTNRKAEFAPESSGSLVDLHRASSSGAGSWIVSLRKILKKFTKAIFTKVAYEIRHTPTQPVSALPYEVCRLLGFLNIDCIFDIGANVGQFADRLRCSGYAGRIISFEPLVEAWETLNLASANDDAWIVHPRCAVGEREGDAIINVAGNSYSSSLLNMLERHSRSAPKSNYVGQQTTRLIRLASVFDKYARPNENVLIKIDTQGYEKQVVNGSDEVLDRIRAVYIELSLTPLYENQDLWQYFVDRLEKRGFNIWNIQPGFSDPASGRTLQVDVVFVREEDLPIQKAGDEDVTVNEDVTVVACQP